MNIDIKTLLLTSLSTTKTSCGSRRLYFGKSCFIVRYEVRGKFLRLTSIKKTSGKHFTRRRRLKRRYLVIRLYQLKVKKYLQHVQQKQNQPASKDSAGAKVSLNVTEIQKTIIANVIQESKEVQTLESQIPPKMNSTATETENIPVTTSAQQTIASTRYNSNRLTGGHSPTLPNACTRSCSKTCQTELNSETKGIQCKRHTVVGATQTDELVLKCSSTQVLEDLGGVGNRGKSKQTLESTTTTSSANMAEREVVIYMLNEIGELVINQNHILNNNTQILGQLSEMSMATKMVAQGKAWSKRRSKKKKKSQHKRCSKHQFLEIKTCQYNTQAKINLEMRHKSIQTIKPEMVNIFTQTTTANFTKPQKFAFLKKHK